MGWHRFAHRHYRREPPRTAPRLLRRQGAGLPGAKGSAGWSNAFHLTRNFGTAPAAMLFNEMTTKIALGAVVTQAPAMTDFNRDPLSAIANDDWVVVGADRGVIEVHPRTRSNCRGEFA